MFDPELSKQNIVDATAIQRAITISTYFLDISEANFSQKNLGYRDCLMDLINVGGEIFRLSNKNLRNDSSEYLDGYDAAIAWALEQLIIDSIEDRDYYNVPIERNKRALDSFDSERNANKEV